MIDIKKKFKEFLSNDHYIRIDPEHVLDLYIGINGNGQCTLEYRGKFSRKAIRGSASIIITQGSEKDYNYLLISLKDSEMIDTFCALCNDIVESTRRCESNEVGYTVIIERLYSWKKLFSSAKDQLQESAVMGLVGELYFLQTYMFKTYGQHDALASWTGQELTHKDFSLDNIWYEIKTIHVGKSSVKISSLEQLQSNNDGELVVIELERMSEAYDGIYLSKLATQILSSISSDSDKDIFLNQLCNQGYRFESENDRFVYDIKATSRYRVDSNFPKLVRNEIIEAIVQAQYDIAINEITPYLITD